MADFAEDDSSPAAAAARLDWLRARGVEVDLAEDRGAASPPGGATPAKPGTPGGFTYVLIPLDASQDAVELTAVVSNPAADPTARKDALPDLLAPAFADDAALDGERVERESAARLKVLGAAPGRRGEEGGGRARCPARCAVRGKVRAAAKVCRARCQACL